MDIYNDVLNRIKLREDDSSYTVSSPGTVVNQKIRLEDVDFRYAARSKPTMYGIFDIIVNPDKYAYVPSAKQPMTLQVSGGGDRVMNALDKLSIFDNHDELKQRIVQDLKNMRNGVILPCEADKVGGVLLQIFHLQLRRIMPG